MATHQLHCVLSLSFS